jgi:hypothetical protein
VANRYFAGNSLAAFTRSNTTWLENTTAGFFDSTYVANCLSIGSGGGTDYIESWQFSATGTIYVRFDVRIGGVSSSNGPTLMNGSTGVFRIVGTSTSCQAQYWNGSAWTNTGSTFTMTSSTLLTVMIKVVLGSSFEVYVSGTLAASGSGWSGGQTTATSLRLYTQGASGQYSQVMIADYDIRNSHYVTPALNGNSATNTGGTGSYTDVGETQLDESTAEVVSTIGNKLGQTKASITVPTGNYIATVCLNARGRVGGGTVTDGKLGARSGSTNSSGSGLGFNGGYEPRGRFVDTDPATGSMWDETGFNSFEPYLEAA